MFIRCLFRDFSCVRSFSHIFSFWSYVFCSVVFENDEGVLDFKGYDFRERLH